MKKLPERKRNTLLMYYFLEMTESEIANLQKITQSGVFRNRHHALETMKKNTQGGTLENETVI